jgi:uncharacterized protein (TIGR03435 family)
MCHSLSSVKNVLRFKFVEVLMKRPLAFVGVLILASLISTAFLEMSTARAQSPAASSPPAFEVASIKPNNSGNGQVAIQTPPGGGFRAVEVTVRLLIGYAYGVRDPQISGGPSWISTDRFDIEAKAADAQLPLTQMPLLVQHLLSDRFQLRIHSEMKEVPVYELTIGKGGSKLEPAQEPETSVPGGAPLPAPPDGMPRPGGFRMGFGQIAASAVPLTNLVQALSQSLGRPVIDKTGLTGRFTFKLTWTPDALTGRVPAGTGPITINGQLVDPNGPSLVTALQEQLGLKVDSTKGPVDVWVIDSVQRPTENWKTEYGSNQRAFVIR